MNGGDDLVVTGFPYPSPWGITLPSCSLITVWFAIFLLQVLIAGGTSDDVMCIKSGRNVKTKVRILKRLACRFVNTTADVKGDVAMLADLRHTVCFQFRQQGGDGAAVEP